MSSKLEIYANENGRSPFLEWFKGLDRQTQARVDTYVYRLSFGSSENQIKALKRGLFELKINYGPGYRVYFGHIGRQNILLLLGGSKATQNRDILKARKLWSEYGKKK